MLAMSNPASPSKPEITKEVGTSRPVYGGSITFSTPSQEPVISKASDPLNGPRSTLEGFKQTDGTEVKIAALTAALSLSDSK